MPKKQYLSVRAAALALLIHGSAIHPLAYVVSWGPAVLASSSVLALGGCAASSSDEEQGSDKFVVTPASTVPLALALAHKGAAFLWTVAAPLGIPFLVGVVANFVLTPAWEGYFRWAQSFVAEAVKPPPAVGRYASLSVTSMATFLLNQGAFANGGKAAYDRYIGDINKVAKLPTGTDAETIAQLREINHRYGPASAQAIDRIHQALSFLNVSQFNDLWERWANLSDAMTNALLNHANQDSWAREYGQRAQQLLGGFSQDHSLSAQQATNLTQAFVQTPGVEFEGSRIANENDNDISFKFYVRKPNGNGYHAGVSLSVNDEGYSEAKAQTESDGNDDGDDDNCKQILCNLFWIVSDGNTGSRILSRSTVTIAAYSWERNIDEAIDKFCLSVNKLIDMIVTLPAGESLPSEDFLKVKPNPEIFDENPEMCKPNHGVWWFQSPADPSSDVDIKPWLQSK